MKAIQIIQDAYRFGNIVAEEGQDLTVTQMSDGVRLLNYIINEINVDGDEIALNAQETITITPYQNTVTLTDYITLWKIQYNLGTVWVDSEVMYVDDFYNVAVIQTAQSIPYVCYAKRVPEGIQLMLYFTPEKSYALRIVSALKKITNLQPDDDLVSDVAFYQELLMWKLANDLRMRNQMDTLDTIQKKIKSIEWRLKNIKTPKVAVNLSPLGRESGSAATNRMRIVADANIMGGYRP